MTSAMNSVSFPALPVPTRRGNSKISPLYRYETPMQGDTHPALRARSMELLRKRTDMGKKEQEGKEVSYRERSESGRYTHMSSMYFTSRTRMNALRATSSCIAFKADTPRRRQSVSVIPKQATRYAMSHFRASIYLTNRSAIWRREGISSYSTCTATPTAAHRWSASPRNGDRRSWSR